MSIIIRNIDGHTVALNAALVEKQDEDIYLNDAIHHALTTKFGVDFRRVGFMKNDDDCADKIIKELMINEEIKRLLL